MYWAELKGKVPGRVAKSEDTLTSNVFSFLKYADREMFLGPFLERLDVVVPKQDLSEAEFLFWPVYPDRTEPDVVIVVGDYYLLFEAKYGSGFGEATDGRASQLKREHTQGSAEAKNLGKQFRMFALTEHYARPERVLAGRAVASNQYFRWINWQSITVLLLEALDAGGLRPEVESFAGDLCALLDKRRLRPFRSLSQVAFDGLETVPPDLFFPARNATHRGHFIGFSGTIGKLGSVGTVEGHVFFEGSGCSGLGFVETLGGLVALESVAGRLFYKEVNEERG